jgi:hypothetical protein
MFSLFFVTVYMIFQLIHFLHLKSYVLNLIFIVLTCYLIKRVYVKTCNHSSRSIKSRPRSVQRLEIVRNFSESYVRPERAFFASRGIFTYMVFASSRSFWANI